MEVLEAPQDLRDDHLYLILVESLLADREQIAQRARIEILHGDLVKKNEEERRSQRCHQQHSVR